MPARFRSAEIFGREKRLDELTRTTLFGPTRITLDLLACTRLAPPLPGAIVGPGPDVLITENSDPYWVLVDLLRDAPGHRIGVVAWGSGRSFPTQVDSLRVDVAGRGPITGTAWYWGDCDPAGLAIADAAASVTAEIPIRPATGLWAAMARSPVQERGSVDWTGDRGARWLGTELWSQLEPVRSARGRIAQEAVSVSAISEWVDGSG
ncbi:hypothetical protein [Nocardia sp. NBC_00511]|uniref:hypothetical protein n=1 Tax=Nocardia sp. NBC_00511 TaxID=2903591 RepID=UPI0030E48B0F